MWAPFGSKYQTIKDPPLKDEFDEWLARVVMFCFSLPPDAFVRRVTGRRPRRRGRRLLKPVWCSSLRQLFASRKAGSLG